MYISKVNVVSSPVTALIFEQQIEIMLEWAKKRLSKVVCVANVHMLMEAHWHADLKSILETADMVTPDGMPLVWMMRLLGAKAQDRVAGLDIFHAVCHKAALEGVTIYLIGSTSEVLDEMKARLQKEFPKLEVAGIAPLPFRPLTEAEDEALMRDINESGAGFAMVSLGCPKQEKWMAQHRGSLNAVMIGLGGAFPVYAGLHKRAPKWIRDMGFEWLYRLLQEPKRLWKRYGTTIPPFIILAMQQLMMRNRLQRSLRT
ncbi:MAG: WecB/TagA/CpsF family glycosyltransferase [Leptolyngbya sp. SIO4C1]|nr:WecB/TagA/CpsF family glycosyltransferase [Leptolyngbya sp. SIO4C1]